MKMKMKIKFGGGPNWTPSQPLSQSSFEFCKLLKFANFGRSKLNLTKVQQNLVMALQISLSS
jgi:hypothetical protein